MDRALKELTSENAEKDERIEELERELAEREEKGEGIAAGAAAGAILSNKE